MPSPLSPSHTGIAAGLCAFLIWGLLPVYWKALGAVPPLELLCHRIVWSLVFLALVVTLRRGWAGVAHALRSRRDVLLLAVSSMLVSANWFLYIWAVNNDHVVESSLGYYINPLVNVLLGFLVFRDRLRRVQTMAILLATAGVLNMVWHFGRAPWLALVLALTFGLYGLARKVAAVESLNGLLFETLVLGLPATGYLWLREAQGLGALGHLGWSTDLLLAGAGVVTATPLLLFAFAARRLRLSTVGVLQYLAPTGMFLLGVFVYREPFTSAHMLTFLLIWAGVALYTADGLRSLRPARGGLPREG
ncbi:EamA family transporter RarD [Desulfocurvus vexinensis]|uniref:EamA family transporter RarD n=1 Tax=Desulfocurvus vexinensis TaxID=399548 RepID=UPI000490A261|nr:EamA family transporter RarD [Desulfocurvus vexinensis]